MEILQKSVTGIPQDDGDSPGEDCDGDSPDDGDTPGEHCDGDSPDGDSLDGDSSDGDSPEDGDGTNSDVIVERESPEVNLRRWSIRP